MTAPLAQLPLPLEPALTFGDKVRVVARYMDLSPRQMQIILDANTADVMVQERFLDRAIADPTPIMSPRRRRTSRTK